MINKLNLLNEIVNNTYVVLRPSSVAGVGVFALRDIPMGCRDMFRKPDPSDNWIKVPLKEVESLPEHARFLIWNYCLFDEEHYYIPDDGFKKPDLCLFLNHSEDPNIRSINGGDYFEAIRDIHAGEELFLDYGDENVT